jgi:pilus assembly protein CpaE
MSPADTPSRILLAIENPELAADVRARIEEIGGLSVVGVATSAPAVIGACEQGEIDAVLLHEDVGPLPLLHLTRDLVARFPALGVVLLVADPSADLLRGALQAGARGVTGLPLSFDALETDLAAAASWARTMQSRFATDSAAVGPTTGSSARMFAFAGSKGGVGTSTIALHLALEAAETFGTARSVCFVDFDLQTGDAGNLLDLEHRRSVVDLLDVAEDLSERHLDEALYRHPSGLSILLAPHDGEQGEDVTAAHARQILAAVRARFDVVVVDLGSVASEATLTAAEMADSVLLVTTPDVPSMRGANRLLRLWERLDSRREGIEVLVNRASRISDVQPDLVDSVVAVPRVPTAIPADYRDLQPAVNSGTPSRAATGPVREAIVKLGTHLGLWPARRGGSVRRLPWPRSEAGQGAVEFVGLLPVLVMFVALVFQLSLAGLSGVFAHMAASEGGRALARDETVADATQAAADRLPDRWAGSLRLQQAGAGPNGRRTVQATVEMPVIVPFIGGGYEISASSGYVHEPTVARQRP